MMAREPDALNLDQSLLRTSLVRLLRPLVRLLIRAGITFPDFMALIRELYVNVAEHDFLLAQKVQTDSRVSLLTGIHRKEVRRLRGAGAPVDSVPAALSLTGRILARWLGSSEYTDAQGRPRPLARGGAPGQLSFESLVALETVDVRPRAVLDEWVDRGLVRIDANGDLVLIAAALLPRPGSAEQLYYFGRNLHDHVAASTANILGRSPAFFDRSVHYDGLSAELALALVDRSNDYALKALDQANRDAQAGVVDQDGSWRWNFGIYVYAEDERGSFPKDLPDLGARKP